MDLLKVILQYAMTIVAVPLLWGLPTAVAYAIVSQMYSEFGTPLRVAIAWQCVALVYAISRLFGNWGVQIGVEILFAGGVLLWAALRPGRPSLIGLLVYQATALVMSGMLPLINLRWGTPGHRAAFAVIVLRTGFIVLLRRQLRIQENSALPSTTSGA
jgi:hypothetical protein